MPKTDHRFAKGKKFSQPYNSKGTAKNVRCSRNNSYGYRNNFIDNKIAKRHFSPRNKAFQNQDFTEGTVSNSRPSKPNVLFDSEELHDEYRGSRINSYEGEDERVIRGNQRVYKNSNSKNLAFQNRGKNNDDTNVLFNSEELYDKYHGSQNDSYEVEDALVLRGNQKVYRNSNSKNITFQNRGKNNDNTRLLFNKFSRIEESTSNAGPSEPRVSFDYEKSLDHNQNNYMQYTCKVQDSERDSHEFGKKINLRRNQRMAQDLNSSNRPFQDQEIRHTNNDNTRLLFNKFSRIEESTSNAGPSEPRVSFGYEKSLDSNQNNYMQYTCNIQGSERDSYEFGKKIDLRRNQRMAQDFDSSNRPFQDQEIRHMRSPLIKESFPKASNSGASKVCAFNSEKSFEHYQDIPMELPKKLQTLENYSYEVINKSELKGNQNVNKKFNPWEIRDLEITAASNHKSAKANIVFDSKELCDEQQEVPMEVDGVEMVQELRKVKKSFNTLMTSIFRDLPAVTIPRHSEPQNSRKVYLVIDTCTLIGKKNIEIIEKLLDTNFPDFGYPYFIIPWVVIQELDALKSDGKTNKDTNVQKHARTAINFVYLRLVKKHRRLFGQSINMALFLKNQHEITSNDDQILRCCLYFQEIDSKNSYVLLSNDKNLCSKAMISGIDSFATENVEAGLQTMFQSDYQKKIASSHNQVNRNIFASVNDETDIEKYKPIDEIYGEIKTQVCSLLSVIIEVETKKIYDDLWMELLPLKPPWTLTSALVVIDKLWIAVFSFCFPKRCHSNFLSLKKFFVQGYSNDPVQISRIISDIIEVLSYIKNTSIYFNEAEQVIDNLRGLRRECKSISRSKLSASKVLNSVSFRNATHKKPILKATPTETNILNQKLPQYKNIFLVQPNFESTVNSISDLKSNENTNFSSDPKFLASCNESFALTQNPNALVQKCLDEIWTTIENYCGYIMVGAKLINSFNVNIVKRVPSIEEIKKFLPKLFQSLQKLRKLVLGVIEYHTADLCPMLFQYTKNFHSSLELDVPEMIQPLTLNMIISFCKNQESRDKFIKGYEQLTQYYTSLMAVMCKVSSEEKIIFGSNY